MNIAYKVENSIEKSLLTMISFKSSKFDFNSNLF